MKVGLFLMALAPALLIAAVVSATLRSEPERLVAAEVAAKSPGEAPRYSSGQEGSATKNSSREKDSPHSSSGEESLGFGSSSSGGPIEQHEEDAKEPQAVLKQEAQTPRPLSPQRLNRRAGKHFLEHPMGRSPNHTNERNRCLGPNKGAGLSPPKKS